MLGGSNLAASLYYAVVVGAGTGVFSGIFWVSIYGLRVLPFFLVLIPVLAVLTAAVTYLLIRRRTEEERLNQIVPYLGLWLPHATIKSVRRVIGVVVVLSMPVLLSWWVTYFRDPADGIVRPVLITTVTLLNLIALRPDRTDHSAETGD